MKKICYIIVILTVLSLLCSCGGNNGDSGKTPASSSTQIGTSTTDADVIKTTEATSEHQSSESSASNENSETGSTGAYSYTGTNVAIGSTSALEPGQTFNPLDRDNDGWIDIYV